MRAMYRPSIHHPETAWARHLDKVRQERGWSANQLFKFVREEIGLGPDSRSTFVAQLHRDPKPRWIPGLIKLFGEPPAELEPVKVEPPPDLAAALSELAAELRASREQREKVEKDLADLKAVVQRLVERGNPTNPGLGVPPETAV